MSGEIYKQIGRNAAGPVCIAAAYDRVTGAVVGLTASSFVTLSFQPPMVMFAIQQHADSYAYIVSSKAFGVSLLGRGQSQIASEQGVLASGSGLRAGFRQMHLLLDPPVLSAVHRDLAEPDPP